MKFSQDFTAQLAEYMKLNNLVLIDKRDADRLEAISKLFDIDGKKPIGE